MPDKYITSQRPTDKSIKNDARIAALYDGKLSVAALMAELVFRQGILEQDNLGRFEASSLDLKAMLPLHPVTTKLLDEVAQRIHNCGLAFRYNFDGHTYFQYIGTINRQTMVGNMRRMSALPQPPVEEFSTWLREFRHCDDESINMYVQVYTCNSEGKGSEVKGSENKRKREKRKEDFLLPEWIDMEAWDNFVIMREEDKAPFTDRAQELILMKLDKLHQSGNDPKEVFERSTMNGWKDLFEVHDGNGAKPSSGRPTCGDYESVRGEKIAGFPTDD